MVSELENSNSNKWKERCKILKLKMLPIFVKKKADDSWDEHTFFYLNRNITNGSDENNNFFTDVTKLNY